MHHIEKLIEQNLSCYAPLLIQMILFILILMQDPSLVRCDSLDTGSGCDGEVINDLTPNHKGFDPIANLEPSPAELAQCEAEVGTLLSIIAELNKKMGSLKAPRLKKLFV